MSKSTEELRSRLNKILKDYYHYMKLAKARYSNIESIVHGELVKWGWDIQTANDVQHEITEQVVAYMSQYTVPKSATLNNHTKDKS